MTNTGKFYRCGKGGRSVNSFKFDASEVIRRETKLLKRWKFIRRELTVTMANRGGMAAVRGISTAERVQRFISGKQMETSGRCWPDVQLSGKRRVGREQIAPKRSSRFLLSAIAFFPSRSLSLSLSNATGRI